MSKGNSRNKFDINDNYWQHCCTSCDINFNTFTCFINSSINKYYTNNKFDFNRILGKLGNYCYFPIDKMYYLEITI